SGAGSVVVIGQVDSEGHGNIRGSGGPFVAVFPNRVEAVGDAGPAHGQIGSDRARKRLPFHVAAIQVVDGPTDACDFRCNRRKVSHHVLSAITRKALGGRGASDHEVVVAGPPRARDRGGGVVTRGVETRVHNSVCLIQIAPLTAGDRVVRGLNSPQ